MDLNKIKVDCTPLIEECGLTLYSLEYKKENGINLLEFVVDKKGFVDMSEVEDVTGKINEYLDKEDPIDEDYSLSVLSRGSEKDFPFDDASYYLGEWVEIKTYDQLHTGELIECNSDSLLVKTIKNKKTKINANDILSLRTVIKF